MKLTLATLAFNTHKPTHIWVGLVWADRRNNTHTLHITRQ